MKYADILDIEWALKSAELRAKSHWDDMLIYKDSDSCLYEMAYDKVKELRDAQKALRNIWKIVQQSNIELEYRA